jgi:peptide deformylase
VLKILQIPNKKLTAPNLLVEPGLVDIPTLSAKMRFLMNKNEGVGLAAPQIGVNYRLFIYEWDKEFKVCINPEILSYSEQTDTFNEGCLSISRRFFPLHRSIQVITRYTEIDPETKEWNTIIKTLEGYEARIFQHETDHINGITIMDRIPRKDR